MYGVTEGPPYREMTMAQLRESRNNLVAVQATAYAASHASGAIFAGVGALMPVSWHPAAWQAAIIGIGVGAPTYEFASQAIAQVDRETGKRWCCECVIL